MLLCGHACRAVLPPKPRVVMVLVVLLKRVIVNCPRRWTYGGSGEDVPRIIPRVHGTGVRRATVGHHLVVVMVVVVVWRYMLLSAVAGFESGTRLTRHWGSTLRRGCWGQRGSWAERPVLTYGRLTLWWFLLRVLAACTAGRRRPMLLQDLLIFWTSVLEPNLDL